VSGALGGKPSGEAPKAPKASGASGTSGSGPDGKPSEAGVPLTGIRTGEEENTCQALLKFDFDIFTGSSFISEDLKLITDLRKIYMH
jgi:hypothetical protein